MPMVQKINKYREKCGMRGNLHVPCGAGEQPEIESNAYLLQTINRLCFEVNGTQKNECHIEDYLF
jgi:hypothetical protein